MKRRGVSSTWSKMCVSSGEVFSGPPSPHKWRVVSLDSQNPVGGPLIYRQEIDAFILYRTELQVWSKMCVSSGEVFSGPSSPHKGRVVSLDSQNPVGGLFDLYARNCRVYPIQKWTSSLVEMCVSSGEVFSGPSSPHKVRVVSLDLQNPVGGPFDIKARNCRVYPI